jgi:hypothetical protein
MGIECGNGTVPAREFGRAGAGQCESHTAGRIKSTPSQCGHSDALRHGYTYVNSTPTYKLHALSGSLKDIKPPVVVAASNFDGRLYGEFRAVFNNKGQLFSKPMGISTPASAVLRISATKVEDGYC